jgi:AAA family ATP:ADP antiporter
VNARGPLLRTLQRVVDVRDDEVRALFMATFYGFCIFLAYYILRPVRDEISSADRGNLQIIWTVVFLVMLVAVPAYSWLASRYGRRVFVPVANRFFLANLLGFYAALYLLPESARPWIDRAFYVWGSVFALFVVTVFWGFLVDVFTNAQGRRLFAFIAVGASVGGIAGSAVSAFLAESVGIFALLLLACVPLEIASWCALWLHRNDRGRRQARTDLDLPLPGTAFSGMRVVFRSPYLMAIAGYLALMTFASTVLYFQQAFLVGEAIADRAARASFFAQIDLAVNILTIVLQVAVTARILRWLGVGFSLMIVPALTMLGFVGLGLAPLLAVLVVLQVLYRAGRYGIAKPVREVLFTVVSREERYKSKAFLDAAVYRGGDLVSGWIYAGLAAVGLSVGAIALVAAPLAALWVLMSLSLGRRHERLAAAEPGAA